MAKRKVHQISVCFQRGQLSDPPGVLFSPQMQEMYDMIMKHKRAMAEMQNMWEKAIKEHQHEYDSDEEVDQDAGTWEHQLRKMEMEKTRGKTKKNTETLLIQK